MGTDIYMFAVSPHSITQWESVRNYDLAALLGYIKGSSHQEPYHRSRGLPVGLSQWAREELCGRYQPDKGDHNATWMTFDELRLIKQRYESLLSFDDDDEPYTWSYEYLFDKEQPDTVLVFWFNS